MSSAGRPRLRKGLSIAAWTAISLLAAAGVLVAVGLPSAKNAVAQVYPHPVGAEPAELSVAAQRAPDFDPARSTVAILLAAEGTNIADTLAPYEVFARSGVVNVFLVAERAEPVMLGGGLTVLPQRTLAQIDEMTGGGPGVIVVSQMHGDRSGEMRWVRDSLTHDPGTVVMSVCLGAEDVADAGIRDGRRATTHWLKLVGLRRDPGDTEWVDSVRFVEDGPTISSAGVLSGIDAAMRVVERLGGSAELPRIADEIRWRGYGSGAGVETETPGLRPADLPFALGAAFRWDRPHNGVLLTPGVGEIELASAFRPYTELSWLATLTAVSHDGKPVTSRHGVTVIPASDVPGAGGLDRLLVPGAEAARTRAAAPALPGGLEATYLHSPDRFAFDPVIDDIAVTYDRATAKWVAKSLQYPVGVPAAGRDDVAAWPWAQTAMAATLVVAAIGVVQSIRLGVNAARRRSS
ncbi:DJ-1/PfpI family protein [Gordonia paraffinivorans]|uniref:DJ-1/PfpI family protein n=1 Tax=Gordonia paraffinivorans TaxID=175628 RepID=UPI001E44937A|nr:DJ-1/PfpI family protein [Gordonia paraffinivorans]MCD2145966.1 DJ-1/PfpI family protein [Gordonia paraffinivorans]